MPCGIFFRGTTSRGGGGRKKVGPTKKGFFFPCRTYHTTSWCSHRKTCFGHPLASLLLQGPPAWKEPKWLRHRVPLGLRKGRTGRRVLYPRR